MEEERVSKRPLSTHLVLQASHGQFGAVQDSTAAYSMCAHLTQWHTNVCLHVLVCAKHKWSQNIDESITIDSTYDGMHRATLFTTYYILNILLLSIYIIFYVIVLKSISRKQANVPPEVLSVTHRLELKDTLGPILHPVQFSFYTDACIVGASLHPAANSRHYTCALIGVSAKSRGVFQRKLYIVLSYTTILQLRPWPKKSWFKWPSAVGVPILTCPGRSEL